MKTIFLILLGVVCGLLCHSRATEPAVTPTGYGVIDNTMMVGYLNVRIDNSNPEAQPVCFYKKDAAGYLRVVIHEDMADSIVRDLVAAHTEQFNGKAKTVDYFTAWNRAYKYLGLQ